jgi:putative multiple sugar transport system permease protein
MNVIKQIFGTDIRQFTMVFALVALLLGFHFFSGGNMLTPGNMQNLIAGNA